MLPNNQILEWFDNKEKNKIKELPALSFLFSVSWIIAEYYEEDNEKCCDMRIFAKVQVKKESKLSNMAIMKISIARRESDRRKQCRF